MVVSWQVVVVSPDQCGQNPDVDVAKTYPSVGFEDYKRAEQDAK